jgi:hypothetical protein
VGADAGLEVLVEDEVHGKGKFLAPGAEVGDGVSIQGVRHGGLRNTYEVLLS